MSKHFDLVLLSSRLTRPIRRRGPTLTYEAVQSAFDHLVQRSLKAQEVRDYISSSDKTKFHALAASNDRKSAQEFMSFIVSMFEAGDITEEQHVFYASMAVESLQQSWQMNNNVQAELPELASLTTKLNSVHSKYDELEELEEFTSLDDARIEELGKAYGRILETATIRLFQILGHKDLGDLRKNDPKKFDELRERGRRVTHHSSAETKAIKDVVIQYENAAAKAASVGAYPAAVVTLSAAIEGLLLLRVLKSPDKSKRVAKSLPEGSRPRKKDLNDPTRWTFNTRHLKNLAHRRFGIPHLPRESCNLRGAKLANMNIIFYDIIKSCLNIW